MKKAIEKRNSERGGAGVKLLLVVLVLFLIGNAGYHFIPVAYSGENMKQEMQTAVIQGLAAPGKTSPLDVVKRKIAASVENNGVPEDAYIEIKEVNKVVQAHVMYTKEVPLLPFGIYNYEYNFDYVAIPSGYLAKQ